MENVCRSCRYYESNLCRRYAPKPRVVEFYRDYGVFAAEWPRVEPEDWCGEWKGEADRENQR